ncbi:MAG: hypothetical protein ACRDOH_25120 [Streptosporangiaceae bacterium]
MTVVVTGLGVLVTGLGVLVVGLGEVLVVWLDEVVAPRLGDKLAITLWAALPQPAARHPIRMAVTRKSPWV